MCRGQELLTLVARRRHLETVRRRPVVLPVQSHQAAEERDRTAPDAYRSTTNVLGLCGSSSDWTANSWRAGLSRSVPQPFTWTRKPEAVRPTGSIDRCVWTLMTSPL